ncbi:MAG: hypothetical protein Q7J34_13345 [Bacteroidales bacterium]|nr:hypothetical protein [Bacteroidales bacterium]
MKKVIYTIAALFISMGMYAQTAADALRYSQVEYSGTARFNAMGGAFGALGGDFSSLSTNPAGIGLYKTSEFTVTPTIYQGKSSSSYFGHQAEDDKYNFNLSNLGVVLTAEIPDRLGTPGWRNVQFGFGINRLMNFNNRSMIEGYNDVNSMLTGYVNYANAYGIYSDSPEELAEKANLIFEDGGIFYNDMPDGKVLQRKSLTTSGSMNELVLSAGANYSDMLYFGVTMGFPYFNYREESSYSEQDINNVNPYFHSYTLREQLETSGTGFNLKAGLIFRPTDWLRIGGAYHSPTFFTDMNDVWSSNINSVFDSVIENKSVSSRIGEYNYELTTPMKLIGSVAIIVGTQGLISADYQYVDYTEAKLRPVGDYYDVNDAIQSSYKAQNIFRVGTEWRVGPFSFRGGYAWYESPFANNLNDGERKSMSLGLGFREQNYFMDFAFVQTKWTEDYYLYSLITEPGPSSVNKYTANSIQLTFGYKF